MLSRGSHQGTSLEVTWLLFWAATAGGTGSIPGQGTKIPQATRGEQKEREREEVVSTLTGAGRYLAGQEIPFKHDPMHKSLGQPWTHPQNLRAACSYPAQKMDQGGAGEPKVPNKLMTSSLGQPEAAGHTATHSSSRLRWFPPVASIEFLQFLSLQEKQQQILKNRNAQRKHTKIPFSHLSCSLQ